MQFKQLRPKGMDSISSGKASDITGGSGQICGNPKPPDIKELLHVIALPQSN
jgi:hypothetical protein